MQAAVIGIVLLLLFMILYYRLPGFIACLSLGIYGTLLLAIFALLPITLTLSGIAAAILSLGMAVDANVLIFERMKEELRAGRTLGAAVEAGFNRAWTAIRDSNITTFIACAVLIWLGTSSAFHAPMVSGFAITLLIGVALSMFTAIVITRTFLRLIVGSNLVTNMAAYGVKA
jgi:preprotein translocase subunit SecD